MSFDNAKWKYNSRLADAYVKRGGRYIAGPFNPGKGSMKAQRPTHPALQRRRKKRR